MNHVAAKNEVAIIPRKKNSTRKADGFACRFPVNIADAKTESTD
ncbi:MAG: hypothetical protein V9F46_13265 [Chitinophagaceae bacterium]